MANSALIDDLRKQFAENPRRVFARLANEYRKRGELDSAIEICRSHVPLQPGYISGHIVLGQALYDSGSLDEARTTFETALALDPENLIALRHMGDIARASGDTTGARSWYHQLLEIDPQNEDVANQLDSLGAEGAGMAQQAATSEAASEGWGEVSPEPIELVGDDSSSEAPAEYEVVTGEEAAVESAAASESHAAPESAATIVHALDAREPAELLAETVDAGEPIASIFEEADPLANAFPESEPIENILLESEPIASVSQESVVAEPATRAVPPLYPPDPYGASAYDDEERDATPSAFATETAAELYIQQGMPDRALAIYRELAARSPEDASLKERVAELEEASMLAPEPIAEATRSSRTTREFFGVLAYRRAPRYAEPRDATAEILVDDRAGVSSEDESAAAALAGAFGAASQVDDAALLANDPLDAVAPEVTPSNATSVDEAAMREPGDGNAGRPGREASDALSLDDVFHDGSTRRDARNGELGVSFDEFFARRENGIVPESSNGAMVSENDAVAINGDHETEDAPQDLELFHAWLDGLKG